MAVPDDRAGGLSDARCTDDECQRKASAFLAQLFGAVPQDLCWDPTHHLRGHAHVGERELVVIAPRDEAHRTVVLTAESWNEIRREPATGRQLLLRRLAIRTPARLMAQLAS